MHLIIYLSDYTSSEPIEKTLNEIVTISKVNNPKSDITGVLFFHNNQFLQVIEGERQQLKALINKIEQDERHNNLTVLIDEPINNRSLAEWNMDSFNLSADKFIDKEQIDLLKQQFVHTCQLDTWLFVQIIKDSISSTN